MDKLTNYYSYSLAASKLARFIFTPRGRIESTGGGGSRKRIELTSRSSAQEIANFYFNLFLLVDGKVQEEGGTRE